MEKYASIMNKKIQYYEDSFLPESDVSMLMQLKSQENSLGNLISWFQNCKEQRAKSFLAMEHMEEFV